MARIFKQKYTVLNKKTGQRETRQTKNWYIEYALPTGGTRVVPGYKDRKATEQYAAELERTAERIDAGLLTPDVGWAKLPISDHIQAYAEHLAQKGDGAKHIATTQARLEALAAGANWKRIADLDQSGVLGYLSRCRAGKGPCADGRVPAKMARETSNHYIRAARAFAAWLVSARRSTVNPLAGIAILNPEVDRRRVRRVLSEGDFAKLIAAAKSRPFLRCGMSGSDRAMLYLLGAYSGLRLAELASLPLPAFRLDSTPPHIELAAADEKAGRGAKIPLPADVARQVRAWLRGRGAAFEPGPWTDHAARMLRGDLKAAGIPFADDRGRVFDFHALRSQYATNLARAGVDLRVAQQLMRHSSPVLTAKHYTRLELTDLADAAAKLPPAPPAE